MWRFASTHFLLLLVLVLALSSIPAFAEPFAFRGYYITLMRMPVMGLAEWKQAIDCFTEDDINTLILWTAGGFRSRKFPITWKYNDEHANVRHDFVRELIDYAHTKKIRVLLGFTPFGYDGVNRYPIEHPELKALKADGSPVDQFGIDSLGWNVCPAKPESQRFMREYIDEMVFDFYPNADGLLIESSDYAICNCPDCGPHFYDHEFAFVRELSDKVWRHNPNALILVYPHYFTGAKVPGLNATAAKQPFDPRWGLIFAPHSAHFDPALMSKAKTAVYWSDATALHTPHEVAAAARTARQHKVSGFIPSLEAFSFIPHAPESGEPWIYGKRIHPFGFDPQGEGKMPYSTLPLRVQRFAYRTFSHDPNMEFKKFEQQLGEHFFGSGSSPQFAADLLELQRIWSYDSDWYWATPLLDPAFFAVHAHRLKWPANKLAEYDRNLASLRAIASRNSNSSNPTAREMARLAAMVVEQWDATRQIPSTAK
jgi:hypothetical protein